MIFGCILIGVQVCYPTHEFVIQMNSLYMRAMVLCQENLFHFFESSFSSFSYIFKIIWKK